MYRRFIKRILDIVIAFIALLLIGWLILIIALVLAIANRGTGAFFKQERPGYKGKPFKIIKFKTMSEEKDADGNLLPSDDRITKVGAFLRNTSLDELPQLINVLKGEMALVGPRPLLMRYLPLYSEEQMRRHDVLPGITGWAQVHGRNSISWTEKFKLDVWYVDHISLKVDIQVLFLSVKKVFAEEGINTEQDMIPEDFNGTN